MDLKNFLGNENELPLERLVSDGGFVGIFRKIGCVGDSLASGEFEIIDNSGTKRYLDYYDYSWGQYIARMAGCTVYNFSRGGMTAEEYCESFANINNYWSNDKACNAYIIALGCNDIIGKKQEVGHIGNICDEDYRKNKKTFTGYYAQIIQRLKKIQPEAKFFLVTLPKETAMDDEGNARADSHRAAIYEISKHFSNCYVIDLRQYAPPHDEFYKENFQLLGHLNPMGYMLSAKQICSYMDYIIRHNMKDFKFVGLMGVEHQGQG